MTAEQITTLSVLVIEKNERLQELINDLKKVYVIQNIESDIIGIQKMIEFNNELLKELKKIKVKNDRII